MLKAAKSAMTDADIIIYVTDVFESAEIEKGFTSTLVKSIIPVILVINKIDKSDQLKVEKLMDDWKKYSSLC